MISQTGAKTRSNFFHVIVKSLHKLFETTSVTQRVPLKYCLKLNVQKHIKIDWQDNLSCSNIIYLDLSPFCAGEGKSVYE